MIVDSLPVTVTYRPAQAFTGRFEVFGTLFCDDGTYSTSLFCSPYFYAPVVWCVVGHTHEQKTRRERAQRTTYYFSSRTPASIQLTATAGTNNGKSTSSHLLC